MVERNFVVVVAKIKKILFVSSPNPSRDKETLRIYICVAKTIHTNQTLFWRMLKGQRPEIFDPYFVAKNTPT